MGVELLVASPDTDVLTCLIWSRCSLSREQKRLAIA
jgi:hypothetical protein